MAHNGMGINEVGMVNGAMSRKVEITLNSAVSLVQMLQPILFIPCYGIGCPIRWFPPFKWAESKGQLYHNGSAMSSGGFWNYSLSKYNK